MTKQELNRDIKRLLKRFNHSYYKETVTDEELESQRTEFLRLDRADSEAEYMNRKSIIAMHRMNQARRYKPLHLFGINWKVN